MNQRDLLKNKNVVLVARGKKIVGGVTTDKDAIVVGVVKKITPWSKAVTQLGVDNLVPLEVNGVLTDVIEVGVIRALQDRTDKWRPAPGGVSAGHFAITAGSTGPVVKKQSIRYSLSNNHVYANSNQADIYDAIFQPGAHDGGANTDIIGQLAAFVPINFTGDSSTCPITRFVTWCFNGLASLFHRYARIGGYSSELNKVDAAICRPVEDTDLSDEILGIGKPAGFNTTELQVGQFVKKSGRTSGVTEGFVIYTEAAINVMYGDRLAAFEDQVVVTAASEPGDSGSAVLNEVNEVVGLLFAGSDTVTIINKIGNVIDGLGLDHV